MQRSKFKALPLFTIASLVVLGLAGCGTAAPDTQAESQPADTIEQDEAPVNDSGSTGEAVLSYGDINYTAELQHCSLSGGEDALFHGVARDGSGNEVGYLDGDFGDLTDVPYGEARIDFGATKQFQSTDEFIAMGTGVGQIVVTAASENSLIIMGGVWDQDGTQLSTATLKVDC